MKTYLFAALSLCLVAAPLPSSDPKPAAAVRQADGPTLTLPAEAAGPVGGFITIAAETNGKTVAWHAIDPGLNLFPIALLKDTRTAVVTSSRAGRYRLLAYTAVGDVPSDPAIVTVVVGDAPPPGPGPGPGPTPPPVPDLTGIAKAVYDAASGVDKAVVSQSAGAYGSQVSAINAGAYNAVALDAAKQQIADAIAESNPPREKAAALFDAIDGELQRLEEAGKLTTLAAVSAALAEITTGLEAASK